MKMLSRGSNGLKTVQGWWRVKRTRRRLIAGLGLVLVIGILGAMKGRGPKLDAEQPVCQVERGELLVTILQTGEIEPKSSRDFINEAARDAKIIEIVDDGSVVTNGQLLFELEASELDDRYLQQKIKVANAESGLAIAELQHKTDLEGAELKVELAKLELKKYVEAEYPQQVLVAESNIKLAQQELTKARNTLTGTKELFDKEYASRQDLESDQLGVDRKEIEVRNKSKELEILQNYTHVKKLKELQNAVANAETALQRLLKTYSSDHVRRLSQLEVESNQLKKREKELANTKVYADFDGQVFYVKNRRRGAIEKGAQVHFRQKILSFPDLSRWELKVGVPEALIDQVKKGQKAMATLDAVPDELLEAKVSRISAVPNNQNWLNSDVKSYTVRLDVTSQSSNQLKPGMSAVVEVLTERLEDVLQVPIQAVASSDDKQYVYVLKRGRREKREVQTGQFNNNYIQITEGVEEGEELLLYAEIALESEVELKKRPLMRAESEAKVDEA